MADVVVVGGGFAGMSVAARLAKLRHQVTLLEASDQLGGRLRGHQAGGHTWQLSPDTVTLPGVLRDLFRKSGRPLEKVVDLVPIDGRRHVFSDRTALDLPMGRRSDQVDAVEAAFGDDAWTPWVDTLADRWDVLRRSVLERVIDGRDDVESVLRSDLSGRRSVRKLARKDLRDDRLRAMVRDELRLDGQHLESTPSFVAVQHYVERNFGRWQVDGGLPALADALTQRLEERGVEVRLRTAAHELTVGGGRVTGVVTDTGSVDADVVVWCAPTWPAPLPEPRGLPAIPASRMLLLLDADAPDLPRDLMFHGKPAVRLWTDGSRTVTVAHHNAEDPLTALKRAGIRLEEHVLERHDLGPAELVRMGHWGWAWQGWSTVLDRPGTDAAQRFGDTLFMAGAHAHPGPTIEEIGMATAALAEHLGAAPR
jgi:UDP-galactopyranose mutase